MKTEINSNILIACLILITNFALSQTPVQVSLSGDQRDMQPDFFGFNGMRTTSNNLSWNDFTINNANSYWPVNPFHQFDLGHLRYPGGGVGNYWDFRKGWFLDQNQIPADMELETPYNSAFPGSPTFDDRMNAFKTTSNLLNTTPLFCINKLSSDILYQKAMLYHAKENGLPLKYVELGSELYSTLRNNVLAYPTATHYAQSANKWAGILKSVHGFNEIKCAALGTITDNDNEPGRRRLWNDYLLEELKSLKMMNSLNIDAMTIQEYIDASLGSVTSSALMTTNEIQTMLNRPFEALNHLKDFEFKKIEEALGSEMEIWMTEFNLFDNNNPGYLTHSTWAHGLFAAAMTLCFLEEPSVSKVTMHTALGNGVWSSFFSDNNGLTGNSWFNEFTGPGHITNYPCSTQTVKGERSAAGSAIQLIAEAMKHSTLAEPIVFNSSPQIISGGYDALYGWKFYSPRGESAIILNLHENEQELSGISSLFSNNPSVLKFYTIHQVNENDVDNCMLSVIQNPVDVSFDNCELFFEENDNLDATVNLTLKPHSITLLRLNSDVMSAYVTEPEICSNTTTTIKLYGYTPPISFTDNSMQGVIYPTDFEGTFLFDPQGIAGVYSILFADNNSNSVQVTVTVHEAPDLILNYSVPQSICPPLSNPLHFNASLTTANPNPVISYVWTPTQYLTNPNGQPDAYYLPDTTIEVIVYASDGRCWVSSTDNVIRVDSDKPQFTIDDNIIACTSNSGLVLSVQTNQASNYTYLWSDNSTNAQITLAAVNPGLQVYTVTVSGNNACSVTHEVKVKGVECCSGTPSDVAIYPDNANHFSTTSDLTTAISNVCPGCVISTLTLDDINCNTYTGTIYINGRHRVTKNVNLKNCSVKFGEEAEIMVMPVSGQGRRTLFIEGGNYSSCTQQLWNRIYASGEKTAVIFNDYPSASSAVSISGARTALDLSNHAEFGFHNVNFSNNKTHISFRNFRNRVLPNFTLPAPARYFTNCSLSCSTPGFTDYAVFFENCTDFTIGRPNQSGGNNTLEISGSRYGVHGINATVNIRNTYLHDITRTAIHLKADYAQDDHRLTVGSSGSRRVKIERCPFGIFAYGDINLNISGNNSGNNGGFHEISNIAIQSFNNSSKTVTITENQFTQFNRGVYVYNTGRFAENTVSYNTFNGTLAQPNEERYAGTAISFINPLQGMELNPVKVFGNSITNARIGIHGMNMTNYHVAFNPAAPLSLAGYNNISFNLSAAPIVPHIGIFIQSCPGARIVNNTITNNANLTTGIANFRGIDLTASTNLRINCNTITNLPRSINFTGNCNLTKLKYNIMTGYQHGVYLEPNAFLPAQGDFDATSGQYHPYDNWWGYAGTEPPSVLKVSETNTPISWYYRDAPINTNPFYPQPASSGVLPQQTALIPIPDCLDFIRYADRENSIGKAVKDSLLFDENANENMYQAKQGAYKTLKEDSTLMYQNNPDDYVYENFLAAMDAGNMGLLDSVRTLMNDSTNFTIAGSINSSINDTNNVEYYSKTMNEIQLNFFATGELSSSDSVTLDYIAHLPLSLAGTAIFTAAAHLGLEIHQNFSSATRKSDFKPKKEKPLTKNDVFMYPNPAFDKAYFYLKPLEAEKLALIEIYDNAGNKIMMLPADTQKIYEVNVQSFAAGIYSYRITCNDKEFKGTFSKFK